MWLLAVPMWIVFLALSFAFQANALSEGSVSILLVRVSFGKVPVPLLKRPGSLLMGPLGIFSVLRKYFLDLPAEGEVSILARKQDTFMEIHQKNKLSMYLAVLGVMEKYDSVWLPLSGIAAMVQRLEDLVESIQEASGIQGTPRDGIAKGKNRKQVAMINLAAEVAGDVHSLAVAQKNDVLAGKSAVEISDLVNTPDTLVAARCREIHKLGKENSAGIAPFGTGAEDLAALDLAIKDYEKVATAPRQAVVAAKGVTGGITADFQSGDALLKKEIDKGMRKFRRKNPQFAQEYADARIIVDLGGGKSAAPGEAQSEPGKPGEPADPEKPDEPAK